MNTSSRRVLFACACLGLLAFGIVLTTLGTVLPSIIERFGIDKAQAGALFLLMSVGILAGSLVFGPLVDRYGHKGILLTATALIVVGLEGIAFAPSMGWLRVAILIIGFGGGIINGGTNALVADISTGERGANLNLLGVFFGVGAVGVPFVLATLSGRFSLSFHWSSLHSPGFHRQNSLRDFRSRPLADFSGIHFCCSWGSCSFSRAESRSPLADGHRRS